MVENAFYGRETQGSYELHNIGNLVLEENAETLRNCRLAYRVFGTLNAARDNAILVTTWFAGTGKDIEANYIGAAHALNPEKYFIIVVDQIGSGTSSSPHNTPAPQAMAKFPYIRIGDDVAAQHRFVTEKFGITQFALVIGCSMGGMQTYEWAVRFPDMLKRAAIIGATAKTSWHQVNFTETLQEALTSDPGWKAGWYQHNSEVRAGMDRLAKIAANHSWSADFFYEERWGPVLGMSSFRDFINGAMKAAYEPMDPNCLLCQLWKWQRADVSRHTGGDLSSALQRVKAKTFIMPVSHDMFFPPKECEADQRLIPGAQLRLIESKEGHISLLGFTANYMEQVDAHLTELLSS